MSDLDPDLLVWSDSLGILLSIIMTVSRISNRRSESHILNAV